MCRLKSLGALVVAPLTGLLVLACDTGQESSLTAPSPSFTVVGNPVVASASGSGHFKQGRFLRAFSFTAKEFYDGTVQGRFAFNPPFAGAVTCITVEADMKTARIGGIITNSDTRGQIGRDALFTVVDNSEGSQSPADQTSKVFNAPPSSFLAASHCASGLSLQLSDIARGNIQVDRLGGP